MADHDLGPGEWILVGLTRTWRPTPAPGHLVLPVGRSRYRQLVRERYTAPTWWPTPAPDTNPRRCEDTDLTCARRLRDALAEADAHDNERESA